MSFYNSKGQSLIFTVNFNSYYVVVMYKNCILIAKIDIKFFFLDFEIPITSYKTLSFIIWIFPTTLPFMISTLFKSNHHYQSATITVHLFPL